MGCLLTSLAAALHNTSVTRSQWGALQNLQGGQAH